ISLWLFRSILWAESTTTGRSGHISLHSIPPKLTCIIHPVFPLLNLYSWSGSKHNVSSSTSANTGIPPLYNIALAVDTNDNAGNITSLPLMSNNDNARCNDAVPELTAITLLNPVYSAKSLSNSATLPDPAPLAQKPLLMVSITASSSSLPELGSNNLIPGILIHPLESFLRYNCWLDRLVFHVSFHLAITGYISVFCL